MLNAALLQGRYSIHESCKSAVNCYKHWRGTDKGADARYKHAIDADRYGLVELFDPTGRGVTKIGVS